MSTSRTAAELASRGVVIHAPESVHIADEVNPDRIGSGVVIHAGCRIRGAGTSIGPRCVIGAEGPATLDNCRLGSGVQLAAGFFSNSTFMDGVSMGADAHVRPGCLLEESVTCGHGVGLKQTLLMPYVAIGSLINFCDVLMSGGTSRRNHSEVGSSYVHFNFTPLQDKATASLLGDVPRGVLLDQPPIFLGGQGGLVGPLRVEFGTVVAAGSILRHDVTTAGQLIATAQRNSARPFARHPPRDARRLLLNNLVYAGNIAALECWYKHVRRRLARSAPFDAACVAGALETISFVFDERLRRLDELHAKIAGPGALAGVTAGGAVWAAFAAEWPAVRLSAAAARSGAPPPPEDLTLAVEAAAPGRSYSEVITALPPEAKRHAQEWLQGIVSGFSRLADIFQ